MRRDVLAIARRFAPDRRVGLLLVVAALAQSVALVPIGLLVADAFGERIPRGDESGLVRVGAAILALYLVDAGLRLFVGRLTLRAGASGSARLRAEVIERLYRLPVAWHAERSPSQLHAAVMPEVERVEATALSLFALGPALVAALPLTALAVIISPQLALVVAVAAPALLLIGRLAARRIEPLTRDWQDAWVASSRHLDVGLRTVELTRTRAAEEAEIDAARGLADALGRRAFDRSAAVSAAGVTQGAVSSVSGVLVLVVGGMLVADGELELSRLLGFYAVLALLLRQISGVAGALTAVAAGLPSYRGLLALLDDPSPAAYDGTRKVDWDGSVALERVGFGYDGAGRVLDGLDLRIGPGEHVALVGANGSGKSTVAALVVGLRAPDTGVVSAGGVPYGELDLGELRRQMGVVPQRLVLRPGTLAENVAYGVDVTPEQLDEAAVLAGLRPLLDALPDGWATRLEDESVRLSGGEAQRVALARALVGRPRLLVLDEPTNHLDGDAVAALLTALGRLERAPSILTVTHDLLLADHADRIVTLTAGRAVAEGSRRRPSGA